MAQASDGEAAVGAMLLSARRTFEALRHADEATRAARIQALHAEYEQPWTRVRAAAEALDQHDDNAAPKALPGASPAEIEALRLERRELRLALAARNRELKDQIDSLRQLLCAAQLSGT